MHQGLETLLLLLVSLEVNVCFCPCISAGCPFYAQALMSVHWKQLLCYLLFLGYMSILSSEVPSGRGHLARQQNPDSRKSGP